MKKKILITLIAICTLLFAFNIINASAATDGIYTYTVNNNKATITDCVETTKGDIIIPDTLGGYPVVTIGDSAFQDCFYITKVTMPDSVTRIEKDAFLSCTGITEIKLSENTTYIGAYAFTDLISLKKIKIPSSVKEIGVSAFMMSEWNGKPALEGIYITDIAAWCNIKFYDTPTKYAKKLYLNGELITDLVIPDGVTSIGKGAFLGCSDIVSVTIPGSITSMEPTAFMNCTGLKNVTIKDGAKCIGFTAFLGCKNLESINIPNSVTLIDNCAFEGCESLKSITIPDSVTTIIGRAFNNCSSLEFVEIGRGLEEIFVHQFENCKNLKYIVFSKEIKYVLNGAFDGCPNIDTVFYTGSENEWNEILFYSKNENLTSAKIVYNATKKTYKFETNCDIALNDITDYAIFDMPTIENDRMTLTGWYDNASLSGEPVTFPYYGDAITLYAAWTDRTGKNFDDAFIAKANQEYTVSTTESGQLVYFEFVPNLSKEYRFYTTGSQDTYGYLYDSNQSRLASDDDGGDGNNFYISYNLTAGETYYITAKLYSGTGNFTFVVEEPVDYRINEITIKDMSGNNLQAIPTGTFLATVSFTNVSSSADTVIILAQYTDAGAFKGLMYIQTEDVPTGSTIKLSIPVDNSKGDIAKLKAFCWDSFGSLTPMGNSVSFPAEQ